MQLQLLQLGLRWNVTGNTMSALLRVIGHGLRALDVLDSRADIYIHGEREQAEGRAPLAAAALAREAQQEQKQEQDPDPEQEQEQPPVEGPEFGRVPAAAWQNRFDRLRSQQCGMQAEQVRHVPASAVRQTLLPTRRQAAAGHRRAAVQPTPAHRADRLAEQRLCAKAHMAGGRYWY